MKNLLWCCTMVLVLSCQTTNDTVQELTINSFDDPVLVEIESLQDRRDSDALLVYLNSKDLNHRLAAIEAFASIQDTLTIDILSQSFQDSSTLLRKMTAYSLGQMYNGGAASKLMNQLSVEDSVAVRKVLWEALGKCIEKEDVQFFSNAQISNEIELEGYAWGLYRAGIRGLANDTLVQRAVELLYPENTFESRFAAAYFMARAANSSIDEHLDSIIGSAMYDRSPFVRMASTSALRNSKDDRTINALAQTIIKDSDYRVRINALRTLRNYEFVKVQEAVFEALYDDNVNVAITAASIIEVNANSDLQERILSQIENANSLNWRVKSSLMGALLSIDSKNEIWIKQIKSKIDNSSNAYEKAALINVLGKSFLAYDFIVTKTLGTDEKVISTAGIGALAGMREKEGFPSEIETALADVFRQAILTGDLAMIGTATSVISNPKYNYRELYDTIDFLYQAKEKLELPKDNEGLQSLQAAIDYFENNEKTESVVNDYNHPINWELVETIKSDAQVKIITERGSITVELMVDTAPGSVANFIDLVRNEYYNSKNFHRVVPNFVAQGGCNRGDGWGGEDYSIRSELGPAKYGEGYVGMASAGKDTEGTQWFITHSPTPHLDGRYSIFGRVINGMEVVHQLEVGDRIISIEEI